MNQRKTLRAMSGVAAMALAASCGTARADLDGGGYISDPNVTSWNAVNSAAPFYTSVSSANLASATTTQGQPSAGSGAVYTLLSETFTITNGAGGLAVNTNFQLTGFAMIAGGGTVQASVHLYDITTNLTSNNGTKLNGSGATYNRLGDLLGNGAGLAYSNSLPAARQVYFGLTAGPGSQDQVVLGLGHTYALEVWCPATTGTGEVWFRLPSATPADPGGQMMGSHDSDLSVARLTITSLGLAGGAPRTAALALYGTPTSAPPTVAPPVAAGGLTNYFVDKFDPAGTGTNSYSGGAISNVWRSWFGAALSTLTWDPNSDAQGSASSGSMKLVLDWSAGDQFLVFNGFAGIIPPVNGLQFNRFECDVRFDPSSASTTIGSTTSYGYLQFGTRTADSQSQDYAFGSVQVSVGNTNWVHVSTTYDAATDSNLGNIYDVLFHIYGPYGGGSLSGTSTLWIDNVKFVGPTNYTTPAPPTVAMEKAKPALRIFAGDTSQSYMRENIATIPTSGLGWYGAGAPLTYLITITNFPDASVQGYEFHVFLIPTVSLRYDPYSNSFADYDTTNLASLTITANGSNYLARFAYKVNLPSAVVNTTLATITSAQAVGTWTLRFNNNTSMTLTTPQGTFINFTMPDADASKFADPVVAYFGVQPNTTAGEGQYVDLSRISVDLAGIDENFTEWYTLDTGTWNIVASVPASIWQIAPDSAYWLNWTLPDVGFGLGESTNLTAWVTPSYFSGYTVTNTTATLGFKKWSLLPQQEIAPGPKAFFGLRNPAP
ncbi:MAG: hypothetical protein U1F98_07315 [Verrucomicrobiota bacterium]